MSTDVAHLDEARRILRHLDDDHRFAVYLALHEYEQVERYDDDMVRLFPVGAPRTATNIIGAIHGKPPVPARRKVGLLEAIRGVECCDPAVRASWRLWRLCGAVVCVIVGASLIAGTLVGAPGVGLVLGVAATMSMSVAFSMMRGSATVCH
jgi:hypothetical protein